MKKVIVAMSGGVDSSVAAWILKNQGYHVEGLFMKNWEEENYKDTSFCSYKKDIVDIEKVCKKIKINFSKVNFSFEYWNKVFKFFLKEYKRGKTPNPDILCNKKIKFQVLLNYARNFLGADYIATGHYVRKYLYKNKYFLFRGIDKKKDQSYFLYSLNQNQLRFSIFPLGNFKKFEVRKIAENLNLSVSKKKDSFGICFIGEKKFNQFLSCYIKHKPGKILTINDEEIGCHNGLMFYTIGQRRGLKIGGIKNKSSHPWYVAKKNFKLNQLVVVQGKNNPLLFSRRFITKKPKWINDLSIFPLFCSVRTRHLQSEVDCQIFRKNKKLEVFLRSPIFSVTPGQSAVFYIKDKCLGGAIIDSVF